MNRKKHLFGMYFEALRQTKTIGSTFIVILSLQLIISLMQFSTTIRTASAAIDKYGEPLMYDSMSFIEMLPLLLCIGAIMIPLMFIQLYGWLGKRSESDFYHSLPVKRSTIFVSNLLAVLTWSLSIQLIFTLLGMIIFSALARDVIAFDFSQLFYYFSSTFVAGFMISGALIMAKCLVGNGVTSAAVTMMILFFPRVMMYLLGFSVAELVPKSFLGNNFLLDYSINLLLRIENYRDVRWESLLYSSTVMLVYFALDGYLFINRKSENAGKTAINKFTQAVFSIIPAICICQFSIIRIAGFIYTGKKPTGSDYTEIIGIYMIAVFAYFFYVLISTKKISSVLKSVSGLAALVVLNILCIVGVIGYAKYEEGKTVSSSNIEQVRLYNPCNSGIISDGPEGRICYNTFSNPEMLEFVAELINKGPSDENNMCSAEVYTRGVYREFQVNTTWDEIVLRIRPSFWDSVSILEFPRPYELEGVDSETAKLYRLYYEDCKMLGDEKFSEKYSAALLKYYEYTSKHGHIFNEDPKNPVVRKEISGPNGPFAIYISEDFSESYSYYVLNKRINN